MPISNKLSQHPSANQVSEGSTTDGASLALTPQLASIKGLTLVELDTKLRSIFNHPQGFVRPVDVADAPMVLAAKASPFPSGTKTDDTKAPRHFRRVETDEVEARSGFDYQKINGSNLQD